MQNRQSKNKAEVMDDINLSIIQRLWDGRMPYADIAKELGITTNTVRNRVNKMKAEGILQIIGLVDPKAIKGAQSALVTFKVEVDKADEALKQISEIKGVVSAAAVSGSFDIVAVVFFNESYSHEHFLFKELVKVKGLKDVETHIVLKSVNWQLRYAL